MSSVFFYFFLFQRFQRFHIHGKKIKLNTNSDNGRKHWKINLIKELLHSRDYEIYEPLKKNELEFFIVDLCTT